MACLGDVSCDLRMWVDARRSLEWYVSAYGSVGELMGESLIRAMRIAVILYIIGIYCGVHAYCTWINLD
jgi:hypothetical protein